MAAPERPKTPWVQSNLGAGLVAGAVIVILTIVVNTLLEEIPGWARLVIIGSASVVGLILNTFVNKAWRDRTWIALGRWLKGLGILTNKKRRAIEQSGYDRRSSELEHERAFVKQPAWRIDARDALGERNLFWLNNHGHPASEVRVVADPELFVPEGDVFWAEFSGTSPGGSVGAWFKGHVTDRAIAEGVNFNVTWRDGNGDPHEADVFLSPDEIRGGQSEAIDDAWARGRSQGRQEILEEQAAEGPQLPLPYPRWRISFGRFTDGDDTEFIIENLEDRSVAREVRVDAEASMVTFTTGASWPELSGQAQGEFKGVISSDAETWGWNFTITWWNENGEPQAHTFSIPPLHPRTGSDNWN